jgi:TRAP-type C4-dicarboxylate transport system substrate-binding protein
MMSFSSELVNLNSLHLIDGSDPQLLGIQAALEGAGFATVLIQPGHGLQDVVDVLKQGHPKLGFDSIHIYGHGRSGEQDFGHDLITGRSVREQKQTWQQLGELASPDADLLLYGCNVGRGSKGATLLNALAMASGMDVAASDDITGQDDWTLEVAQGDVQTATADVLMGWEGQLKTVSPSWMNVLGKQKEKNLQDAIAGDRGKAIRQASFVGYHLTNQSGSTNNVVEALQDFWDRVGERTNGKLNMTVLASDANLPGSDNEALLGTANGRFDAITANGPIYSGVIPEVANIMTLLFAYNSSAEGRALVNNPVFGSELVKAGKPYDLRFLPLGTLNSGMRDIATIPGHPITTAADLNGFKLRIPPSPAVEQQLKALNVIPVLTPVSQLDEALETGQAYGEENPPSFIQTFDLTGITNQLSLSNHLWTGFLTSINLDTWKSWPKQWRQIVLSEQRSLQEQQWAAQDQLNQQIIEEAPTVYDMSVVTPNLSGVATTPAFVEARNSVIQTLSKPLRPLARAIVQGYRGIAAAAS